MEKLKEAGLEKELVILINDARAIEKYSGGTDEYSASAAYENFSRYLGNQGYVCTWTVECMDNCN